MGHCYFTKIIKMDAKKFLLAFKSVEYKNIVTLNQYNNFINETLIQSKTNGLDISKEFTLPAVNVLNRYFLKFKYKLNCKVINPFYKKYIIISKIKK